MRPKRELSKDEMAYFANKYFIKHFKTYKNAAEYFETNSQTVWNIVNGKQPPSKVMLQAFNYEKNSNYKWRKSDENI